ncbi:MAG: prephenate dehydratase [Coxiella sp. (in: Bacteria)]|nr:MAG: prephenate dehydratase [Coxiella sp. (in: g-proteobacteria)]
MPNPIVGLQGAPGSFSEVAANEFAAMHQLETYTLDYLINSENVLAQLIAGKTDFGIIAIENAQGGVVIETIHALAHHNCKILSLFHVEIAQNLLVKPGVPLTQIKQIHSHQQALRQCRNYLADHFWSCQLVEEDDTAEAARRLSDGTLSETSAVIANANCAELYSLELIAPNIHDLKHNLTLFAAVERLP